MDYLIKRRVRGERKDKDIHEFLRIVGIEALEEGEDASVVFLFPGISPPMFSVFDLVNCVSLLTDQLGKNITMGIKSGTNKREIILQAAKKLFAKNGYENTSVRQIVLKAKTSMGNLYFHFPNKQSILKVICKEYVNILRNQIKRVHDLSFRPEIGFALDLRIGYITTLEHPNTSQVFSAAQTIPEIHEFSLENKRLRLITFFDDMIQPDEINYLAIAIQGIADGIFDQKREGKLTEKSSVLSNTVIDFSLRLIGYSASEIAKTIAEVDEYIKKHHITIDKYFSL